MIIIYFKLYNFPFSNKYDFLVLLYDVYPLLQNQLRFCNDIGIAVNDIPNVAGGLGFDFQVGQIEHSVANSSSSLRRFFKAAFSLRSRRNGPRHSLHASA